MPEVKVGIIYATAGGGHLSLALAAQEALSDSRRPQFKTQLFDPFPASFGSTHKALANYFTDVYRIGLKAAENPKAAPAIRSLNSMTITRKMARFLATFRPDIVIVNHPLAAAALPDASRIARFRPKTVAHFCDPITTHKTWFINTNCDLYLSPTDQMTKLAISEGIPEKRIQTIGWLTRQKFVKGPGNPTEARNHLGLDPKKFTIFLGGAGQGSSKLMDICDLLAESEYLKANAQVIINTGLNHRIVTHVMKLVQKHPRYLLLVPYTTNPCQLLSASDIVVGKAGPNFLFESIQSLKPIIVSDYLPNHEEGNPDLVKDLGIGWIESTPEQVISRLEFLCQNPSRLTEKLPALKKAKSLHSQSATRLSKLISQLSAQTQTPIPAVQSRGLFPLPQFFSRLYSK